jgi:hypothetical protein
LKGKRKRARASEGANAKEKRRRVKHEKVEHSDRGEGRSRGVSDTSKQHQEAVVEAPKFRVSGERAEVEESEEEESEEESEEKDEEKPRGPVGSDDYSAEIFQEEEVVDQLDEEVSR